MRKLSIAFFGDSHDPQVLYHVSFFAQRGHDVRLYSSQKLPADVTLPENVRFKKISTVSYPLTYLTFVGTAPHMLTNRPDIMHAFNLSDYGVLSSLFRRLTGMKPMILTANGKDVFEDAKTHKGWAIKHMMPIGAIFTSIDEMAAQEMVKMGAPIRHTRIIDPKREDLMEQLESDYYALLHDKLALEEAKQEKNES